MRALASLHCSLGFSIGSAVLLVIGYRVSLCHECSAFVCLQLSYPDSGGEGGAGGYSL